MRFARLGPAGHELPVVRDTEGWRDLRAITPDITGGFFAAGGAAAARAALDAGALPAVDAAGLRFGPPVARPGKVVCVGLNYRDHAAETGVAVPDEPVVFLKDPSTVIGAFDQILVPRGSTKTDWEVELAVVIGAQAHYLASPAEAGPVIAGYAVSHDVSEREFQLERGGQWDKGKSCETFNPLGPELVTPDDVADPQNLALRLWVNGELKQSGSTADMIFPVHYLVWYLSQFMVLHPGDVINSGTPAGVALGTPGTAYLTAGDVVELEIEGLSRARQDVGQA